MVHEMESERQAYAEMLEHAVKQALRMVRAFPADRFERRDPELGGSARDVAREFAVHMRRIEAIVCGRQCDQGPAETQSRSGILRELESVYLGVYLTLESMPPFRWYEMIPAPAALAPLQLARRGELLWLSLREMARRDQDFALRLRAARGGDAGSCTAGHAAEQPESLAVGL